MAYVPAWQSFLLCFSRRIAITVAHVLPTMHAVPTARHSAPPRDLCRGWTDSAGWGRVALHLSPRGL
jgi:hypothetical protein